MHVVTQRPLRVASSAPLNRSPANHQPPTINRHAVGAMATVPAPPLIKYRLDFGKALGGSLLPAAVTPVVNYFM